MSFFLDYFNENDDIIYIRVLDYYNIYDFRLFHAIIYKLYQVIIYFDIIYIVYIGYFFVFIEII